MEKLRVFLGIGPLPVEWARDIEKWTARLQRQFGELEENPIRWIVPENLHITLRFFGSVSREEIVQITQRVGTIAAARQEFAIHAEGLALFPNLKRPRVGAIECREPSGELFKLEESIRNETREFGQPPEERNFRPHVTFARIRPAPPKTQRALAELWDSEGPPELPDWRVTDLKLFMSELGSEGSVYSPLATFPLA